MQLRRVRVTHFGLTLALSTALACAAFGAAAGSAMAGGVPSRDSYSVNISPGSVQKGSSTTFDVALANTSTPGRTIGAAAITPPLGFRVTGASLPSGAKGHVYVLFNVILLDRLSVAPGSTLHVAVTATAPSRCDTRFTRWFTVATGGLFGELMFPDPSSSLTTNVTCANPAAGVDFAHAADKLDREPGHHPPGDRPARRLRRQPGRHLRRVRDAGAGQQFRLRHAQRDADAAHQREWRRDVQRPVD